MNLFEIGREEQALHDLLWEIEGDVSDPEVAEIIEGYAVEIQAAESQKIGNCLALILDCEAKDKMWGEEIQRLTEIRRRYAANAERVKRMVLDYMVANDKKRIETRMGPMRSCGNGGKAPLIIDKDIKMSEIDEDFIRTIRELDTDEIRDALDAGEELSFAKYGPRGRHLRYK